MLVRGQSRWIARSWPIWMRVCMGVARTGLDVTAARSIASHCAANPSISWKYDTVSPHPFQHACSPTQHARPRVPMRSLNDGMTRVLRQHTRGNDHEEYIPHDHSRECAVDPELVNGSTPRCCARAQHWTVLYICRHLQLPSISCLQRRQVRHSRCCCRVRGIRYACRVHTLSYLLLYPDALTQAIAVLTHAQTQHRLGTQPA